VTDCEAGSGRREVRASGGHCDGTQATSTRRYERLKPYSRGPSQTAQIHRCFPAFRAALYPMVSVPVDGER